MLKTILLDEEMSRILLKLIKRLAINIYSSWKVKKQKRFLNKNYSWLAAIVLHWMIEQERTGFSLYAKHALWCGNSIIFTKWLFWAAKTLILLSPHFASLVAKNHRCSLKSYEWFVKTGAWTSYSSKSTLFCGTENYNPICNIYTDMQSKISVERGYQAKRARRDLRRQASDRGLLSGERNTHE